MKKCLIIGAAILDLITQIDRLPRTGDDVYAQSQKMTVGGCAFNVASILKHFQIPHTLFVPIGDGLYGTYILRILKEYGFESPLHLTNQDNGYCLCLVERNGERTFLTVPGAECHYRKEWFHRIDPADYDTVYVSGYEIEGEGGGAILDFLEEHRNLKLYYAPGPRMNYITQEKHKRLRQLKPILHLNEKEAEEYTKLNRVKEAADQLYTLFDNEVIITLGEKGAYFRGECSDGMIPSERVKTVDTIGAGDAHIGTIIAMQKRNKKIQDAVPIANKISAAVVRAVGPTLTKEEFEKGREGYE